jgi:sugar phosphate permease
VLARWFPDAERARAQGLLLASSQIGLIVAMPLAATVIELWGWRWMFVTFGLLGVAWAVVFFLWFRDDPAEHPAVNAAEREHIGRSRATAVTQHDAIPWRLVQTNFSIWVLCGTMICGAFNSYFYFSWFPRYLEQARQVANLDAGWLSSMLYLGGSLGMLVGGWLTGRVFRETTHRDVGIRLLGGLAFVFSSASLWLAARSDESRTLVLLAAVSYACSMCTQPVFWSCAITISGRHVGALFGLMNMAGGIGAAASQYFVGHYIGWRERLGYEGRELWDPVFSVYVVMLLLGGVCWSFYRTCFVEPDNATIHT